MKKKIDIDLIIAFIDKKLDKETTKEVRSYIDNDNEWFLEYISLKQADYEIKSEELGDVEIGELSHSLASDASKAYSKKKDSIPFFANIGESMSISPVFMQRISVGMISLMLIGTMIFTSMFSSLTQDMYSNTRYFEGDFTSLDFKENTLTISSTYPDRLNVAITLPSLNNNPDFTYYDFDAFFLKLNPNNTVSILYSDIIEWYDIKSNINTELLSFRVTIYTDGEEIIQDELFE
tara:strand:+ start:2663 stop:3367 length:705 start_codon:yes stop_codon:yes gene_type:complete